MDAVNSSFDELQARLDALAAGLREGDASALEAHSESLHQAVLALDRLGTQPFDAAGKMRLARCAEQLGQIRRNLARRAALAERELAILLPQAKPSTYENLGPSGARRRSGF